MFRKRQQFYGEEMKARPFFKTQRKSSFKKMISIETIETNTGLFTHLFLLVDADETFFVKFLWLYNKTGNADSSFLCGCILKATIIKMWNQKSLPSTRLVSLKNSNIYLQLPKNAGLVSSRVSHTSWGEVVSLTLVDHPTNDDVTIKYLMG